MSQQGCSLLLEAGHVRNHGKLRLNEREILFTSDPPRPSSLQHCLHPTMRFFERRKASQTEIGRSLDESVPGGSSRLSVWDGALKPFCDVPDSPWSNHFAAG